MKHQGSISQRHHLVPLQPSPEHAQLRALTNTRSSCWSQERKRPPRTKDSQSSQGKPAESFPRNVSCQLRCWEQGRSHGQAGELLSLDRGLKTHPASGKSPEQLVGKGEWEQAGFKGLHPRRVHRGTTAMARAHTTAQLQKTWQENRSHFSTSTESDQNLLKIHFLTQKFQVFPQCLPRWAHEGSPAVWAHSLGFGYCPCTCPEPVLPRTEHSIPRTLAGRGTLGCSCCPEPCSWGFPGQALASFSSSISK